MTTPRTEGAMRMLKKVPEITIFFWIIKIMATTVGETAADFLNATLHFGLIGTTIAMGALLLISLMLCVRCTRRQRQHLIQK